MTDIFTIALNRLSPWKGNVRKTNAAHGVEELAASIASHGLLQSLVVREAKRGKYEVIAGRRRYLALQALAKSGTIEKDHPIPCVLADDSMNATEISLVENVVREPMHPADQFEAFRALIDGGATVAEVAARFGAAESHVARRLKLGRLSPVILQAYRDGEIGLEEAQAFALSDNHALQERVYAELPDWNRDATSIRRALTTDDVPVSDKRVRFVGLDTYESAGGSILRDLFGDQAYLRDTTLLDRLVHDRLAQAAETVSAEGWAWVETVPDIDYEVLSVFSRRYAESGLSNEQNAEFETLCAEYDELVDSDDEADLERLEAIQTRIRELEAVEEVWPDDIRTIAGAIVGIDYEGELRVERGLVHREDERRQRNSDGDTGKVTPMMPATLIEDLTAQRSAALGAELIRQPDIALVAIVHALGSSVLFGSREGCLELHAMPPALRRHLAKADECRGLFAVERERERLLDMLPGDPDGFWTWCLAQGRDELLAVLAFVAANAVNAVQGKADRPDGARFARANAMAEALSLDMSAWFSPNAENYFGRVNRSGILAAIDEAGYDVTSVS